MVAIASSRVCLMWMRVVRPGTTPWFGATANANPELLQDGISFGAGAVLSEPLYLTALGTGDGSVNINTGGDTFFGDIPLGYTPGWPSADGGADLINPATAQGSALVSGTDVQFPTIPGYAQSFTGQDEGLFYIEAAFNGDLFTNLTGIGAMRLGPALDEVFNGAFSIGDQNGGAVCDCGFNNTWLASIAANGTRTALTPLNVPPTNVFGIAIAIVNQAGFIPQPFFPVQLPPMSCCSAFGRPF